MKINKLFLVMFFIFVNHKQHVFSANILENSGFEAGKGDKANGWTSYTWGDKKDIHKRTAEKKVSGNYSYYLEKRSIKGGGVALRYDGKIKLPAVKNKKYTIKISGKHCANKKNVTLQIIFYKKENNKYTIINDSKGKYCKKNFSLPPADGWKTFSIEFIFPDSFPKEVKGIPEIAFNFRFLFFSDIIDKVYIDDMNVLVLEKEQKNAKEKQ